LEIHDQLLHLTLPDSGDYYPVTFNSNDILISLSS
jgi:hypothetical protein